MAQTAAEVLIEQGKAEGIVQGKREAVLKFLQFRFQSVPDTLIQQITDIRNLQHLDTLIEQAMTAQSLEEIEV